MIPSHLLTYTRRYYCRHPLPLPLPLPDSSTAHAWGFKQPDTVTDIPSAVIAVDNVVGVMVVRDPRDLVTRT